MKLILLYNTPYNYATEFDGAFKRLLIVIQNSFGHFNAEEEEGFGIDGAEINTEKKNVKDDVEKRN